MGELTEGTELIEILGPQGPEGFTHIQAGKKGCTRIVVTMENGQMAQVPWARAEFGDMVTLVNLALIETVTMKGDPQA